ncbi:2-hydroxyacid dehydrogenase [Paracoccus shanxieyensis]|uniref:2-hydroxyacid dehydrogenase n=1 Tax=Paracoccus shanxieyensis TaxID=2675752 RepID=A0A6L6J2U4_9RHOB|nr:2-hydroxyacid dehydrogenase [Paracoccus shanxieyensis]MTH66178.1 2-hydroxyacid dehydrogenase [Paracoccus shanxieyensis]MTH89473.1 2-hydroxyacid dehydrogenase [Paracoccus shanxieyensis]
MKPDILVAVPLRDAQMQVLEQNYTLHRLDLASDPDALLAQAGPVCRAMVVNGHYHLEKLLLDRLPALELVACSSAGYEPMDLPEMTRRGIKLTNTSDALVEDVANMAVLLALAARRQFVQADAYVRSGDWGRQGMFPLTASTVAKRTGIVGLGNIGRAIATRCAALGHQIGYFGRSRKPVDYAFFDDLVAMAAWADILIVATPGGPETEGLVSAAVIDALGPKGTLVSVARGSVTDEAALIAALRDGRLGSAGLDVYLNEPNPDPALTCLPNAVFYPHHASGTEETRDRMAQLALDNLEAFFAGRPLLSPVN